MKFKWKIILSYLIIIVSILIYTAISIKSLKLEEIYDLRIFLFPLFLLYIGVTILEKNIEEMLFIKIRGWIFSTILLLSIIPTGLCFLYVFYLEVDFKVTYLLIPLIYTIYALLFRKKEN